MGEDTEDCTWRLGDASGAGDCTVKLGEKRLRGADKPGGGDPGIFSAILNSALQQS